MSNYYDSSVELKNKILRRFSMFDNAGLDLTSQTNYSEALAAAGLDYKVKKVPLYLDGGYEIPNKFATIKENEPDKALGIVGNSYVPMNNEDAFELADELVNNMGYTYEAGGACIGAKDKVDYSRSFLVCRGEDFTIGDDTYNVFPVFRNSFDGTTGVQVMFVTQRVVCLNGMVRLLGGRKNQLYINIQHSRNTEEKLQKARQLIISQNNEIEEIKREANLFIGQKFTKAQFEKEIIPLILTKKGLVEKDKERERGQERIEKTVGELIQAYEAADTQNFNNTMYKVILALSDYETHASPLRNTGNGQVYMNRILKGMVLTTAVAQYFQNQYGVGR